LPIGGHLGAGFEWLQLPRRSAEIPDSCTDARRREMHSRLHVVSLGHLFPAAGYHPDGEQLPKDPDDNGLCQHGAEDLADHPDCRPSGLLQD